MFLCLTSLLWCYIVRIKGSFYDIFIFKFCFEPIACTTHVKLRTLAVKSKFYEHKFEFISDLDDAKCLFSTLLTFKIPLKDYE